MGQRRLHRVVVSVLVLALALVIACDDGGEAGGGASEGAATDSPAAVVGQAQSPTATATDDGDAEDAEDAPDDDEGSGDLEGAIVEVVEEARPAVVQITNQQTLSDPFASPMTVPAGVGSGFIFDEDGHILTNQHVIAGASRLIVSLADGRQLEAEVIGEDPQTDLAVLQVQGDDLPVSDIGSSGDLMVGEWVVAIGHALGLAGGPTVTTGVVSALDRTVQEPPAPGGGAGPFLFGVIQTDAPINPGNSGGPLVNLDGEVVGINTLVAGNEFGGIAQGIGFAIAIDTAMPLAEEMIATGGVVHPYVGIFYVTLNPAIVAQLNLPQGTTGAAIGDVVAGSPAADAGLRQFDVITSINGEPIETESDLPASIDALDPGDEIELEVLRDGATSTVTVTLGEAPG